MSPESDLVSTTVPSIEELPRIVPRTVADVNVRWLIRAVIYALGLFILGWHMYYAYKLPVQRLMHTNIHIGLLISVYFLSQIEFEPTEWAEHFQNALTALFFVCVVASTVYVHLNFGRWQSQGQYLVYNQVDIFVGFTLIVALTYAAWRSFGLVFALMTSASFGYAYLGSYFPSNFMNGLLYHSGLSIQSFVYSNSISNGAIYGNITAIVATWVVVFILFAGMVEGYGGMAYIKKLGDYTKQRLSSGVLQTAVVSSLLMGSITGASVANVATTGSFTIPLMKREGVKSRIAGAIESIASTGGQMMPPVMGAASFLMADFLGIPYSDVLVAAILPAIGFYLTLVLIVHLTAKKHGWLRTTTPAGEAESPTPVEESVPGTDTDGPSLTTSAIVSLPFVASAIVLLYTLIYLRLSPMLAGLYTILSLIGATFVRSLYVRGFTSESVLIWLRTTVEGAKVGAVNMSKLTAVVIPIAILVNTFTITGFAQEFVGQITGLAGGNLFVLLLLTMLASILLGMGIPTLAAYLLVAIFVAPPMTAFGIPPLVAHMFVFYFAVLSTITPPVAVTCAMASSIAECGFIEVCYETVRMGLFAFLLPFVFILNPDILLWSSMPEAAVAFVLMMGSLIPIAIGIVGFDGLKQLSSGRRTVYVIVGVVVGVFPYLTGVSTVV